MKFLRAKEMPKEQERVPISIRIRKDLKKQLIAEAKTNGFTISYLIETMLEQYGEFLAKETKRR